MSGREYSNNVDILLAQLAHDLGYRIKVTPFIKQMMRFYIRIFGIPEIGFRLRNEHLKRALRGKDFKEVLDAGCGLGVAANFVQKKYQAKVEAWDSNPTVIKAAQELFPQIKFYQKDIIKLNETERFDLIYSIDVLEHIGSWQKVIEKFFQALKVSGYLIIHVPLKKQRHFLSFAQKWFHRQHAREGFSREELVGILKKAGFRQINTHYTFGFFGTLAWDLNMFFLTKLILESILFPLLFLFGLLDVVLPNKKGICILVTAEKKEQ